MANNGKGLVGLIGLVAASVLAVTIPQFEGTKYQAYRDIAGVWTICTGATNNVRPGQKATPEECQRRTEEQLIAHSKEVLRCTPGLKDKPYPLAAAVSLAYNIGAPSYCRSTVAVKFNRGDIKGGCDGFLAWNRAGGRVVQGLVTRRAKERAICLKT